ncbi:MAG: amidase [Armatimonadetes bacterium]|nr:amidase [Armatimonadota bacterium]
MPNSGMHAGSSLSRREVIGLASVLAVTLAFPAAAVARQPEAKLSVDDLKAACRIADLDIPEEDLKRILPDVQNFAKQFAEMRALPINYQTEPRTVFTPLESEPAKGPGKITARVTAKLRKDIAGLSTEDIAFSSVGQLALWIKTRKISSVHLTEIYLERLKRFGPKLLCVASLCESSALAQARAADDEIAQGRYRGTLHGIPYGVKDLFASKDAPTGWGAEPYRGQTFDYDAEVIQRLNAAGAIMVAKTTLGALAMGDVWYGGKTRNPWDPDEGSSGSSAGSASSTAAGLVAFSIGTETLGSICSPSWQCRVSGLRPTYGRVSRWGGMALSYTMDKVGPICRTMEDCALVLAAIAGHDPKDPSSVTRPFSYPANADLRKMRFGLALSKGEKIPEGSIIHTLKNKVGSFVEVAVPQIPEGMEAILMAESASAFDEFLRSDNINKLENSAWPDYFRSARFVPAVEYIQTQRARSLLMAQMAELMKDFDVLVTPNIGLSTLFLTNLTGHPQAIIPDGVGDKGIQRSCSFIGHLYREDLLASVANQVQMLSTYHTLRPTL